MSFIMTSTNVKLAYTITIKDPTSPLLAIMVHGMMGYKDVCFFRYLPDHLSINTLRFDHQGNGDSDGEFLTGGYQRDVRDVVEVVQWARDNGYKPVALIGHSKAGNTVMIYDSIYADIPLIVTVSAALNMDILPSFIIPVEEKVYTEGSAILSFRGIDFLISKEGLEERRLLKTREIAANVKNWVCVIHGDDDHMTPTEDFTDLCEILGERCFEHHLVSGGEHFIRNGFAELSTCIQGFFDKAIPLLKLNNKI